jgi:hypothetical protein
MEFDSKVQTKEEEDTTKKRKTIIKEFILVDKTFLSE